MALINVDLACESIRGFNRDPEAFANDKLMHRIFGDASRVRPTTAERVVLVDKLWATQMFRRPGHMNRVIRYLAEQESELALQCSSLAPDALEHAPEKVERVALWAMPIVMGHRPGDEEAANYRPYSFASKFLHWTSPMHFPIMDSRARGKINRIQRDLGVRSRVWAGEGYWKDDYPRWIGFFSELVRSLSDTDRLALLDADAESHPDAGRCENSLLRVLDKAFYWG